jgi:hypothetical protein
MRTSPSRVVRENKDGLVNEWATKKQVEIEREENI